MEIGNSISAQPVLNVPSNSVVNRQPSQKAQLPPIWNPFIANPYTPSYSTPIPFNKENIVNSTAISSQNCSTSHGSQIKGSFTVPPNQVMPTMSQFNPASFGHPYMPMQTYPYNMQPFGYNYHYTNSYSMIGRPYHLPPTYPKPKSQSNLPQSTVSQQKDSQSVIRLKSKSINKQEDLKVSIRYSVSPTLFEVYAEQKIKWCRYCGTTSKSNTEKFRSGPWGSKSLCGSHASHYKGLLPNSVLRLDLSSFAEEDLTSRKRPILQDFCWACFKRQTNHGKCVIQCDGCPRAFHAKCLKSQDIPRNILEGDSSEKWYCSSECASGVAQYELPIPRRLPYMISAAKLAVLRKQAFEVEESKKSATQSPTQEPLKTSEELLAQSKQKFIIKIKPIKLEPFITRESKVPKISIETPECETLLDLNELSECKEEEEIEDMSDEAFEARHGKYENLERYTRISLLCLETASK